MAKGDKISKRLLAAARLLSKPGGWSRGQFARTKPRGPVVHDYVGDPAAACFCVAGAVSRVYGKRWPLVPWAAVLRLHKAIGTDSVTDWNDKRGRTQAEAVAAVRKAARL